MIIANDSTVNMSLRQTVAIVYNDKSYFLLIPPLNLMTHIKMEGVHKLTSLLKIAAVLSQNEFPYYPTIRSAISHARNY